jgi:putative ABC transport system permease protein
MRLRNVALLYWVRLRTRLVQELFAVLGIAVGVALLFASQVASTSLDGSARQIVAGVAGEMRLQLAARGPTGFDQGVFGQVRRLPGVRAAVPVLEERANLIGPSGQQQVDLVSTDPRFAHLAGPLLHRFTAAQLAHQQALAVPLMVAQSVGLDALEPAELQLGARSLQVFVGAVLFESDLGALAHSFLVVAPIAYAQKLTGLRGRLTSIYVQPYPGREGEVRAGLQRIAAGRLNVQPADFDATLFSQAAEPADQSAALFSAICALVGFLFAFNALMLTVPQRRNLIEDLRLDGYSQRMIVEVLLFDALVLGAVAALLGLALGDLISLLLFRTNPGYLSFAFSVGSERIIAWQSVALAAGGGLLAAVVGVLIPLRGDIRPHPLSAPARRRERRRAARRRMLLGGVVCLGITTAILLEAPQAAIVGVASLVIGLLLLLPWAIGVVVLAFDRIESSLGGVALYLAVLELRSNANWARSLAIAATGAIAVFGSVAIQGAHSNLQRGLDNASRDLAGAAEVWVTAAGTQNVLATSPFPATTAGRLKRLADVRSVGLFRGGFLDYGRRRVWVIAPPNGIAHPIPASQLVSGNLERATVRLRGDGWAVISQALAAEHDLRVGEAFTLPSPRPTVLRVAALSTNLGWPPGVILMSAGEYARMWASEEVTAYGIALKPGVTAGQGRAEVQRALGAGSGLVVETRQQRELSQRATSREALSRLTQIATLVLIAGILAMATAMGAMIWQRRPLLADMKVDGFRKGVLWRSLLVESALLLGAGCLLGALFGLYGQLLLSHALAVVTGFPVVLSVGALVAVGSLLLVTTVAVLIVAVPGYLAARVRPAIALQD